MYVVLLPWGVPYGGTHEHIEACKHLLSLGDTVLLPTTAATLDFFKPSWISVSVKTGCNRACLATWGREIA